MAVYVILRAAFGYLFLVLMVRIVGRRPGKQLTPFEFVLIFYLGGLTLTGMIGNEASLTNAVCQIITVGFCHYGLAELRYRSNWVARLLDGTPLTLLENGVWRTETLSRMGLQDDDVMDMARDHGIYDLNGIESATLETFGEISILPKSDNPEDEN
jgi:uncharacterized membrane protein YcaP (DUF421 family)